MSKDRLIELEKENEGLRMELKKLQEERLEFAAHKIVKKAQTSFMVWFSFLMIGLTAFGIVSFNSIIQAISKRLEDKGVEKIVKEIKDDFIDKYQFVIVDETKSDLLPQIDAKIDLAVQEILVEKFKKAEEIKKSETKNITISEALEKSYEENLYYVIVGSSLRKKDLESEKERIIDELEEDYHKKEFPELKIYPPRLNNKNYALVFDVNLSLLEAKKLREKAINKGFRDDTYISRVKLGESN